MGAFLYKITVSEQIKYNLISSYFVGLVVVDLQIACKWGHFSSFLAVCDVSRDVLKATTSEERPLHSQANLQARAGTTFVSFFFLFFIFILLLSSHSSYNVFA